MIAPPERSAERDAALAAMLPNVPFDGWTFAALRRGLRDSGQPPEDAEMLFPGGAPDMIEAFCDLADRQMEADAAEVSAMRLPDRVRALILRRLDRSRPHKEAIRRAIAVLALPRHVRLAATCTARTVDSIWHAAGDQSADFSWYTKRLLLTGIYTATLLFWLRDSSEDDAATAAFLDRRLAGIARTHRMRKRAQAMVGRLRPAAG
jgi:ubiquinone biosynthesis protein COQ9